MLAGLGCSDWISISGVHHSFRHYRTLRRLATIVTDTCATSFSLLCVFKELLPVQRTEDRGRRTEGRVNTPRFWALPCSGTYYPRLQRTTQYCAEPSSARGGAKMSMCPRQSVRTRVSMKVNCWCLYVFMSFVLVELSGSDAEDRCQKTEDR
jgi:hypothetical protein